MLLNDTSIAYGSNLLPVAAASATGDVVMAPGTVVTASETVTVPVNGARPLTAKGRGINLVVDVTAVSGTTPSMTVTLQGIDVASGAAFTVPGAVTSAITASGVTLLQVHPDLTAVANSIVKQVLPDTFQLVFSVSGTSPSFTMSVGANYLA